MQPRVSVDELVGRLRHRLTRIAVPGLVSAYLFGSYARDAAHRESDVDVFPCVDAEADRSFGLYARIRAADVLPWYRRYAKIKPDAIRR